MIDHVLGRPSAKSRRLQVMAVLLFWTTFVVKGNKNGPPIIRFFSRFLTKRLTTWQTVVITMIYLYAARNLSTLFGLASPEPMANMYDATYFRATWILTALDAGFWTAMKIRPKWLRDLAGLAFSVFYMVAAEQADEKVRKVRGNLTVEHLRISWNKGTTPYLRFVQGLMRPRFSRWQARELRISRPAASDYKEPVRAWLYYNGSLQKLKESRIDRVVLDLPGGGFVAMDPRCNDDRLWAWAAKTSLPILSLDYQKAPERPYPYALNEAYDVYSMLIESAGACIGLNIPKGSVPRIVVTGDSAGGNLATAMTLMITESGSGPIRRFRGEKDLPLPDALLLFYPGLDMNIGNWMSDEQMALIQDRRMRTTNRAVIRRKKSQYNDLVGTPHDSGDEDDSPGTQSTIPPAIAAMPNPEGIKSPQPEFSHTWPTSWNKSSRTNPAEKASSEPVITGQDKNYQRSSSASYQPQCLQTRLAMSSMISYFNDRILTPEMMRAMIILYVGPHNRPDFSQDYLLSPILAPDILLAHFPKTYFLTGERDPLVDDTVIFAARLRRVKTAFHASRGRRLDYRDSDSGAGYNEKDAAEVVLIPGISHGFMQFPTIYPPAWGYINRAAAWIEEGFQDAEDARRKGKVDSEGRHHFRTESSGDEDRPLEMAMTKARKSSASTGARDNAATSDSLDQGMGRSNSQAGLVVGEGPITAAAEKRDAPRGRGSKRGSTRSRGKEERIVKLASEEDLLGRRMQGLAGGLTGLGEDD